MEDSSVKAKYLHKQMYHNPDLQDLQHISEISDCIKDYNFGDLIKFGTTYAVGKEGALIKCTDSNYYTSIPYQITTYLDDAVNKYSEVDTTFIQLRYDDKFILNNINDKDNIIQEDWGWKIYWASHGVIIIIFPDGKKGTFTIASTTTGRILEWVEAKKEEQYEIRLIANLKEDSYQTFVQRFGKANTRWGKKFPEQLPATWTVKEAFIDGSRKKRIMNFDYRLQGPKKIKTKIIDIINNFYQGLDYYIVENIE
jgi:hypothetical protein